MPAFGPDEPDRVIDLFGRHAVPVDRPNHRPRPTAEATCTAERGSPVWHPGAVAAAHLDAVYDRLRAIMRPYGEQLVVERDEPGDYYVNTPWSRPDGYVLMFGAVQTRARYVSYHLMPVYGAPALLDTISQQLRARMHGKACFNFTKVNDALFTELADLTARAYAARHHLQPTTPS